MAVVQAYYEARRQGNYAQAASFLSNYSLEINSTTRVGFMLISEDQEHHYGLKLLEFKIIESQMLDSQTALVQVASRTTRDDSFQYFWEALRKEDGHWRINLGGLVDYLIVAPQTQTVNNVTIWLKLVERDSDKIWVNLGVKNENARWVLWGSPGFPAAVFHFGDQAITATKVYGDKFEPHFNYEFLGADIILSGIFSTYPTSVDLINWQWGLESLPLPDPKSESWGYHFQIK